MAWRKSLQFMGKQIFLKQILNNIKQHKWNKISYTNKNLTMWKASNPTEWTNHWWTQEGHWC